MMAVSIRCFLCFIAVSLLGSGHPTSVVRAESSLDLYHDDDAIEVRSDDQTLFRYRYGTPRFKPYVDEFAAPGGVNILRDAPDDHLHHHGLMFAFKVNGVNFWEEQNAPGLQQHQDIETFSNHRSESGGEAGCVHRLKWLDPEGKETLLVEIRRVSVLHLVDSDWTCLSWDAEFSLPDGSEEIELTGAHYHGLGMRFLASMDVEGEFRNADGAVGEVVGGEERLIRSKWCSYTATAGDRPVTVALFDHPENPRHPAWWFTMQSPFAYLSATLNLHREPMSLKSGETLRLRYGAAVWDGEVDFEAVEEARRRWLEGLAPTR